MRFKSFLWLLKIKEFFFIIAITMNKYLNIIFTKINVKKYINLSTNIVNELFIPIFFKNEKSKKLKRFAILRVFLFNLYIL